MAKVVLIENDIARYLRDKCKPKGLKLDKPLICKVLLDVDSDAYKALDDDPLLLAKVTEAASKEYYDLVNGMVIKLRQVDALYVKTNSKSDRAKLVEAYEGFARKQFMQFAKDGKKAAEKAWAEVSMIKAEYRTYRIKAGVDLAIDGLNVVGGVASAVGTGGFALIVGLYGIIKTLIGMAMKIYKLAIEADKMQKRVTKNLAKIQKSFDKKKKELSGAKDSGKAFVNSLLGADFLPTVSSVKSDNEQYKNKIQGVDVGAHKIAQKLNQVLKEMDKISKMPDVKSSKKVSALLSKLQKSTAKLIGKIIDMQGQVQKGTAFQKQTAVAIAELETLQPKKWKYIQKGMVLTDIVLAGGDFSKAGETLLAVGTAIVTEVDKELLEKV
ncbi:hypothetical protein [Pseudophaeobacter sp. EL27]|uniref:hypothetical protein n=1 Tax=Pseudophaeobacter sp. EL27 TaxID=2107580 RepID=UPI000EFBE62C|nr:hypothetical protein [Pseudophaeobacter sp. EL27]